MPALAWAALAVLFLLSGVSLWLTWRIATSVDGRARVRLVSQFEAHWDDVSLALSEIKRERAKMIDEYADNLEATARTRKTTQAAAARAAKGERRLEAEVPQKPLHAMAQHELKAEHSRRRAAGEL